MAKRLKDVLPIMDVENDLIVSKQGDVTIVFECTLPEIFALSAADYETLHQAWLKAIRILPKLSVLHKQDWFINDAYQPDFENVDRSFLTCSSDRHFNERPFLDHRCYVMLTQKPLNRKLSSSMFSSLLRPSIVPELPVSASLLQEFLDSAGQFRRILEDSGFIQLRQVKEDELLSQPLSAGLLEKYVFLSEGESTPIIRDLELRNGLLIGDKQLQIFALASPEDLPSLCGPRINYDKYSTDRSKFSVGFAATLGQLLPCNHIYNQYLFIEDSQKVIKKLESKRLRLQSLSAYSRENAITRDAVNEFLNEAIAEQRTPVRAHFNIMAWSDDPGEAKELKNMVSSALAQMDAVARQETAGAAQMFWAGIPGNAADFPSNDCFDTFAEQATCFLNMETGYRSSISPVGIRLGDRLTGKPVHVDISDEPVKKGICTNRNKFVLGPSPCRAILC
jgi:conjugation system TraG family ATPase